MRFTFVILLFFSLGANAQMIIKAHANYRPYAVAQNLLLDDYPNAAAAYSLRKLDKDYTGSAIRVRRSNDNSEQDIGFTSSGDLDTASLKTFVGANSGFVTTWFNQADSSGVFGVRNVSNSTAANQPRIINAGVIDRQNGEVCVVFDGSNDGLNSNYDITYTSNDQLISIVNTPAATITSATSFQILFGGGPITASAGDHTFIGYGSATGNISNERLFYLYLGPLIGGGANQVYGYAQNTSDISGQKLQTFQWYSTTREVRQNGVTQTLSTSSYSGFRSDRKPTKFRSIGYRFETTASYFNGNIHEIIAWGNNQSSNRTAIETNINSYYGIY